MVFDNDQNRQIEGKLILPLGRGKTISRFAMDVNGKIREGVVVERAKAKRVFESIVARRVDPGLLSWVDGSRYEARVFPIPARGTKTIVVRYEEEITMRGRNSTYRLPIDYGREFDRFHVKIRFADKETEIYAPSTRGITFGEDERPGLAEIDETNHQPERDISITFHPEKDTVISAPREGGGRYFYCRTEIRGGNGSKPSPKRIALLWDNSGSATGRQLEREIAFLDAYLKALSDVTVELRVFGAEVMPSEKFKVEDGDWEALKKKLRGLRPDGATAFGAIDWKMIEADEALLFTDGISTLGGNDFGTPKVRVMPIVGTSVDAGDSLLDQLAVKSGGRVVSLHSLDSALDSLNSIPSRLFGTEGKGCSEIHGTANRFSVQPLLAGIIEGDEKATLTISYGFRASDPKRKEIKLSAVDPNAERDPQLESLVYQMWVRAKLAELNTQRRTKWREIAELSTEAGLVTPESSLLVLDFLSDYVNNRIPPPSSEPELLASYRAQVKEVTPTNPEVEIANAQLRFEQWYGATYPWIEETNLRLAKNGMGYIRKLLDRHPDNETLKEDYGHVRPLVKRAERLKREHLKQADASVEKRREWLGEAMKLQAKLEPLKQKYGRGYLKQLRAVREALDLYALDRESRTFSDDPFGAPDADPFGGSSDGFGSADDPFSSGGASSGGGPSFRRSARKLSLKDGSTESIQEAARWRPDAPHLDEMIAAMNESEFEDRYFAKRKLWGRDPLFYVDAGDLAAERGFNALSMRILSNLAELEIDDVRLLRMLAYRLDTHGHHAVAHTIYEDILRLWPEDSVAVRDLALSCARGGDGQRAVDLLCAELGGHSPIMGVVLGDLKLLLADDEQKVLKLPFGADGLRGKVELDLRVVMTWDNDAVEIDLVVVEPANGVVGYGSDATITGGQRTGATSRGFGPEQYMTKRALPGTYTIKANVRPGRKLGSLPAPSMVYVDIIRGYGTDKEERKRVGVRVKRGETDVATVSFDADDVEPR